MAESRPAGRDLPAAPEELAFALSVNALLPPDAHVTACRFRTDDEEGEGFLYGLVFAYFSERKPVASPNPFFDREAVAKEVREWIEELRWRRIDRWEAAH